MTSNLIQGKYILGHDTKVGDPRRKHEDRVYSGEVFSAGGIPFIVGIVADGVGSADSGERGAQLAIDTVINVIKNTNDDHIPNIIEYAIQEANRAVYDENQHKDGDGLTTLTVAIIHDNRCFIGNVGDSRAYWIQSSDKGKMLQLTRDHSYYNIYGGTDPNSEDASVLVNAIGRKPDVYVDLGFYLSGEKGDLDQALRLGLNGLPLKPGDSIMLCSDGLIKTDPMGSRYATDSEIANAIHTEHQTNSAAVKMVSAALGRRPDDNVSAVTIQYLTPSIIDSMKARSASAKRVQTLKRIGAIAFVAISLVLIAVLGIRAAQVSEPEYIVLTSTAMPTMTPTKPVDPGKARVDYAAPSSSVFLGQEITPNTGITAGGDGIRVVIGEQGGNVGVLHWFGGSVGVVDFDAFHMMPKLTSGALYAQPGSNKTEISFSQWDGILASVEGSRMIVELVGNDIWVYCFEGNCLLNPGGGQDVLFQTQPGYKRLYSPLLGQVGNPIEMSYDEKWEWNTKCNLCMFSIIPTPTPIPTSSSIKPTKKPGDEDNEPYNPGSSIPGYTRPEGIKAFSFLTGSILLSLLIGLFFISKIGGRYGDVFSALGMMLLVSIAYIKTLAPGVVGFDSAELATGAFTLGIVHPTGYPLYLLIGHLFTKLPFNNVAYSLNFMSAFFGVLTVLVMYKFLRILIEHRVFALLVSIYFAFSITFWELSTIAEVYTLNMFFVASQIYMLFLWFKSQQVKYLYLLALIFGISLSNHISVVLLLPGVIYLVITAFMQKKIDFKYLFTLLPLATLGMIFYLYLPIRFSQNPKINYVASYYDIDLSSIEGVFWMISGQAYRIFLGGYASFHEILGQFWYFIKLLWDQTLGIGILLGLIGLIDLIKTRRLFGISTSIMFVVFTTFYIMYNVVDKYTMFLPSYYIWFIWVAFGVSALYRKLGSKTVFVPGFSFAAIALLLFVNLPNVDRSTDYSGAEFATKIFSDAPTNAVIVADWSPAVILEYYQVVEGYRPDLIIHNRSRSQVALYYEAWTSKKIEDKNLDLEVLKLEVLKNESQVINALASKANSIIVVDSLGDGYSIEVYGK